MKQRKHYRVAKREAEVRNVKRILRREKKSILVTLVVAVAFIWLEGFLIGALVGKKVGKRSTCV